MNELQRSLIGEVREYAKAQNFDIVIAEGVIYATPTSTSRRRCWRP